MGSVWDAVVQGYYLGKDARGRIDKYKKDKALEESLASAKSAYEKSLNSVQERSEDSPEMANLKGHLQDAVSQSTGGQVEEVGPGVYAPVQAQTDLKPMQAPEGGVVPSRGAPNPQAQAPMVSALGTPPMMRLTGAQAPAGQAPAGGKGFSDYNIQLDRDEPGLYQFKGIYDTPEVRAKNEQEAYQRSLSRRARLSGDKGIPNPSGDPSQTMDVKDLVRYGDKADIAKNQMMAERAYRNAKFDAYRQYYMDNPEALRKLDVEMRQARWGDAYQDLMDGVADGDMDSIRTLVDVHNAAVGENGNRIEMTDGGKFNLVAPDGAILRQNYVPTNSELNRAGALWMAQKIASETGDFAGLTAAEDKAKDWAKGNLDATLAVAKEAREGMDAENVARHRQNTDALGLYGNQIKEEYYRSAGTGGGSGSTASNLAAMGLKSEKNDEGGYTIKNGNVPVGSMSMESSLFIPIGQTLDKVQELAREATTSNKDSVVTFGRTPDGRPANLVVTPDGMAYELGKSPDNKFEFSATGPSGAGGSGGRRQMGRTPPPQLLQQNTDFGSPYSRGRQTHGKAEWGGSPQQTTSQTSFPQVPADKGIPTAQEAKAQVRSGGTAPAKTTKTSGGTAPAKSTDKATTKTTVKDAPKEAPAEEAPAETAITPRGKPYRQPRNRGRRRHHRTKGGYGSKPVADKDASPKKETAITPNPKSKGKPASDPKQIEAERKAISEDVKKHMQYAQDDDAPSQYENDNPEEANERGQISRSEVDAFKDTLDGSKKRVKDATEKVKEKVEDEFKKRAQYAEDDSQEDHAVGDPDEGDRRALPDQANVKEVLADMRKNASKHIGDFAESANRLVRPAVDATEKAARKAYDEALDVARKGYNKAAEGVADAYKRARARHDLVQENIKNSQVMKDVHAEGRVHPSTRSKLLPAEREARTRLDDVSAQWRQEDGRAQRKRDRDETFKGILEKRLSTPPKERTPKEIVARLQKVVLSAIRGSRNQKETLVKLSKGRREAIENRNHYLNLAGKHPSESVKRAIYEQGTLADLYGKQIELLLDTSSKPE